MTPRVSRSSEPPGRGTVQWNAQGAVTVSDPTGLRREGIEDLVRRATFGPEAERSLLRNVIWEAAHEVGIVSASIHDLYLARGQGKVKGFTVPAMNLRGPTFDVARAAFRAARRHEVGAFIFELAKSEMEYTHQPPPEYATSILAAAVREDWTGPVFIQGDHFQFNAKRYAADAAKETEGLRSLVRSAVGAGFHNIDVDASTLVDLSLRTVPEQQRLNARLTADMTRLIRDLEPAGTTISVGGEIGEVGKKNSTPAELRAYLDELARFLRADGRPVPGISKVSIQTGTTHGGVVGKDGKVVDVEVDFGTLADLSALAVREYGLAGCVQHGASTLPDDLFHKFPQAGTAEIHLATGFQNAFLDHPRFPRDLKARIYRHLESAHADERTEGQTLEQFHYKTRKKCFGPFKRELWDLDPDTKGALMGTLEERFGFLYKELGVTDTVTMVRRHVAARRVRRVSGSTHQKP